MHSFGLVSFWPILANAWRRNASSKLALCATSGPIPKRPPHLVGDLAERRLAAHHPAVDAGQAGDERRDGDLRIDKLLVAVDDLAAFEPHDGDLDDPVVDGAGPGRLQVHDGEESGGATPSESSCQS